MLSLKEEANNVERIEDAIDFVNNRLLVDDSGTSAMRSATSDPFHGSLASQDQFTSCTSNPLSGSQAPDLKLNITSNDNEAQIPAELITHCVATLLMIQVNFLDKLPLFSIYLGPCRCYIQAFAFYEFLHYLIMNFFHLS